MLFFADSGTKRIFLFSAYGGYSERAAAVVIKVPRTHFCFAQRLREGNPLFVKFVCRFDKFRRILRSRAAEADAPSFCGGDSFPLPCAYVFALVFRNK